MLRQWRSLLQDGSIALFRNEPEQYPWRSSSLSCTFVRFVLQGLANRAGLRAVIHTSLYMPIMAKAKQIRLITSIRLGACQQALLKPPICVECLHQELRGTLRPRSRHAP